MREETLALQLSPGLSARLRVVAKAAALSVDEFVNQTLEATVGPGVTTTAPLPGASHQEPVVVIFRRMTYAAQVRMDLLMDRHNEGTLSAGEEAELATLVAEYEQIMLANSEQLLRVQPPLTAQAAD